MPSSFAPVVNNLSGNSKCGQWLYPQVWTFLWVICYETALDSYSHQWLKSAILLAEFAFSLEALVYSLHLGGILRTPRPSYVTCPTPLSASVPFSSVVGFIKHRLNSQRKGWTSSLLSLQSSARHLNRLAFVGRMTGTSSWPLGSGHTEQKIFLEPG